MATHGVTEISLLVCVDNEGYRASLEGYRIQRAVPDAAAAADGGVRIIDESGEDYLYPAHRFVAIGVPAEVRRSMAPAE